METARCSPRPSRVGGIRDQIQDGRCGLLIADRRNLEQAGDAVTALLTDDEHALRIGAEAQHSVQQHFLGPHRLGRYFEVIRKIISHRAHTPPSSATTPGAD